MSSLIISSSRVDLSECFPGGLQGFNDPTLRQRQETGRRKWRQEGKGGGRHQLRDDCREEGGTINYALSIRLLFPRVSLQPGPPPPPSYRNHDKFTFQKQKLHSNGQVVRSLKNINNSHFAKQIEYYLQGPPPAPSLHRPLLSGDHPREGGGGGGREGGRTESLCLLQVGLNKQNILF